MTTEISLAKSFQANQKDHVLWFQKMFSLVNALKEPMTSNSLVKMKQADLNKILIQNPMHVQVNQTDVMSFPMIHMAIGLKYAEAVLEGTAWIPEPRQE